MPNIQQAKLKTLVKERIAASGMSTKEVAQKARLSASTLYNWFNGSDEIGELAIGKLSKILGPEIELLFYNDGYEPAKTNTAAGTDEDGKRKAIREIESLINSVDDPGRRLQIINIVRATTRAAVDEYAREGGAGEVEGRAGGRAGRGGGADIGAGADAGEVELNTGL